MQIGIYYEWEYIELLDRIYDLAIIGNRNIDLYKLAYTIRTKSIALLLVNKALIDLNVYKMCDFSMEPHNTMNIDMFTNLLLTEIEVQNGIHNIYFEYNNDSNIDTFRDNILTRKIIVH